MDFKKTILIFVVSVCIIGCLKKNGGLVEQKSGTEVLFVDAVLNTQQTDSILEQINNNYKMYKDDYKIYPIKKVNVTAFKKRIKEINETVLFYKGIGKSPARSQWKHDTLLNLSALVGEVLKIKIDSTYSKKNYLRFFGYIEKCKGTTWACFTLFDNGMLSGQIDGLNHRVVNFEPFCDSIVVGVNIPFNIPGRTY